MRFDQGPKRVHILGAFKAQEVASDEPIIDELTCRATAAFRLAVIGPRGRIPRSTSCGCGLTYNVTQRELHGDSLVVVFSPATVHLVAYHRDEVLEAFPDLLAILQQYLPMPGTPTEDELLIREPAER